ncbi:MAG: hypothetical protein ACKOGA_00325, partial [Planctomycetaceae bacterium]
MSQNHNTAWALRKFAPNRWRVELSSAAWPGLLLCLLAMTLGATSGQSAMAAEPPNIVFMLSDDQGWSG